MDKKDREIYKVLYVLTGNHKNKQIYPLFLHWVEGEVERKERKEEREGGNGEGGRREEVRRREGGRGGKRRVTFNI